MATSNAKDAKKPKRLGRGLSSLLSEPVSIEKQGASATPAPAPAAATAPSTEGPGWRPIAVGAIVPNRYQPRHHFDEEALERLAQSIRSAGVMQPIVVRPLANDDDAPAGAAWELIAGERRWRAAQRAGLSEVPAVIASLTDRETAEWSLVENLQREDLNPIERARAFQRLQEHFELTQAEIARRVGLERSTIANLIRLTELEELIQDEISAGRLSPGHGKALLGMPSGKARLQTALRARDGEWSVRRLEQHVQQLNDERPGETPRTEAPESSARAAAKRDLERRLRDRFGTKVRVHLDKAGLRGRIQVDFYDLEQLDGVLARMGVSPDRT